MAPFSTGEVGCYRFLPAFFFPPLAFFAIFCYPPLHVGLPARALTPIARGCRLARSPDVRRSSRRGTFRELGRVSPTSDRRASLGVAVSEPPSYQM